MKYRCDTHTEYVRESGLELPLFVRTLALHAVHHQVEAASLLPENNDETPS